MKKKGFSLVEVILAMVMLSIIVMSFSSAFSTHFFISRKGYDLTVEHYHKQSQMENAIHEKKISFDDKAKKTLSVFSGVYKTDIVYNQVSVGEYSAVVPKHYTPSFPIPRIKDISITSNLSTNAFPWSDQVTHIKADYQIESNPAIALNQLFWLKYDLLEGFEILEETQVETPNHGFHSSIYNSESNKISPGYYFFEARPYTMEGRLAYYLSERFFVLDKGESSAFWQGIIEKIYLDLYLNENSSNNNFIEIDHNVNRPTLHLDSGQNIKKYEPIYSIDISSFSTDDLNAELRFQVDKKALKDNDKLLGMGIFLEDGSDKKMMIDLDFIHNQLLVHEIENESKKTMSVDIQGDFQALNWSNEMVSQIKKTANVISITFKEHDASNTNEIVVSFESSMNSITSIGLNSYSGIDYLTDLTSELGGYYRRNFTVHFYDLVIDNLIYVVEAKFLSKSVIEVEFNQKIDKSSLTADLLTHDSFTLSEGIKIKSIRLNPYDNKKVWIRLENNHEGYNQGLVQNTVNLEKITFLINGEQPINTSEIKFNIAAAENYLPVTNGLVLHLSPTTLTAAKNGTNVDFWYDLSLSEAHASPPSGKNAPKVIGTEENVRLQFNKNGNNDSQQLVCDYNPDYNVENLTVVAVFRPEMTGGWFRSVVSNFGTVSGQDAFWGIGWLDNNLPNKMGLVTRVRSGNTNDSVFIEVSNENYNTHNQLSIITGAIRKNNNRVTSKAYLNGHNKGSQTHGRDGDVRSGKPIVIGHHGNNSNEHVQMTLAEIIIFNRVLNDDELANLHSYLNEKYRSQP